jgi:uncharacterized protein (DUF2062 family)/SAM-dependent methyltransferase
MVEPIRRRVRHILAQHTSPGRLAAAVFVGCVIGCTPLFGFHLPICIAAAFLLGLNQIAVYGAANISVPPLVPLIGFAATQLGERILHGRWLALARADFTWAAAPSLARRFFTDWLIGGLAVGSVVGALFGALIYAVAVARRATRPSLGAADTPSAAATSSIGDAIARASARYRRTHPRFRWYARMKYRLDPCYRLIAELAFDGELTVDLGTGLGMLPVLLGELGRHAVGIEWDRAKAHAGAEAARDLAGVEIIEGDARTTPLPACDMIALVDVLHYYDTDAQRALLGRCRAVLRPGGRIVVREGDRGRGGGARWTRFLERAVTRLGWNRGPRVHFRSVDELRADLEAPGFRVRDCEASGRLHPGNVLLVAERVADEQRP